MEVFSGQLRNKHGSCRALRSSCQTGKLKFIAGVHGQRMTPSLIADAIDFFLDRKLVETRKRQAQEQAEASWQAFGYERSKVLIPGEA